MNKISVVILAAGFGTRMRSKKPKVLFEISGLAMIFHILKRAYEISDDVSVVLYHQFDEIKAEILAHFANTKIYKQDAINFPGTAGALFNVALNGEKTLVLCGDMPLVKTQDLRRLCETNADITLSAFKTKNPFGYGRILQKNGKIIGIVEEKDANEMQKSINLVNAGCYAFKSEILKQILPKISNHNAQKEFYLTDSIKIAIDLGFECKFVEVCENDFMGINDKFALSVAQNLMQNEIKKNLMKNGVLMRMPDTIYIDCNAKFSGECEIYENTSIIGECEIENSVIKSGCVIENSVVKNSDIGPLAHIRPGCEIINSHVGNFVELKKAKVNTIKAGHLSYLGDCEIGEGTNVGCGTITCNYDGKSKHKTIIGKNVFIGSDTQLVAPVNIEDDVLIAAGSTITQNIKSGCLSISRGRQINKEGFFYKFFGKSNAKK